MQPKRIATIVVAFGAFGLGCLCLLGGCGDETRTTGTQLQVSEERKAMFGGMQKDMMREQAEKKAGRAKGKQAE